MSIESVMSRIAEIQGAMAPPAPVQPPAAGTPFSTVLQGAMGPGKAGQTAAAGAPAAPGTYPHLDGDLDANPELPTGTPLQLGCAGPAVQARPWATMLLGLRKVALAPGASVTLDGRQ